MAYSQVMRLRLKGLFGLKGDKPGQGLNEFNMWQFRPGVDDVDELIRHAGENHMDSQILEPFPRGVGKIVFILDKKDLHPVELAQNVPQTKERDGR